MTEEIHGRQEVGEETDMGRRKEEDRGRSEEDKRWGFGFMDDKRNEDS